VPLVHAVAIGVSPHAPFTHVALKHSASVLQNVLQVAVAELHAYGAQKRAGTGSTGQFPFPSHVNAGLGMFPLQPGCTQTVPAGSGVQRPALPGSAQLWQLPSQAEAQHTPSSQNVLAQSIRSAHGSPIFLGPETTPPPAPPEAAPPPAPPMPVKEIPPAPPKPALPVPTAPEGPPLPAEA
jgi:hypothetical protein